MAANEAAITRLLEKLTGQDAPSKSPLPASAVEALESGTGWGYSQFNEVLLLLGYDRVCPEFFQFFVDGSTDYATGSSLRTVAGLEEAVGRFQELGLLLFGSIRYAFKRFRIAPEELVAWIEALKPRGESSYEKRHRPIQEIEPISPDETYLLGYLIEADLKAKLAANPHDQSVVDLENKRRETVDKGKRNHSAYLVSDHLDVYVATSMRMPHEYVLVSEFCRRLFSKPSIEKLQLRWFDPTLAYCADRIDKGLAEALMLKRAKCTIYLVQESDTLGKDSELASTLAQGKPVIAYVPETNEAFVDDLVAKMQQASGAGAPAAMLKLLRLFHVDAAWENASVREWLADPTKAVSGAIALKAMLVEAVRQHYEKRARMLKEQHPLGIQVNLATGVANGVLVVRTEEDCAEIVRRIMLSKLEFWVDNQDINGMPYTFLREKVSGCIFRVLTGDQQLANAFWNFYLQQPS